MRVRLVLVLILAGGWMAGITCRLYELQVRRHEEFSRRAERQQQRIVEIEPPRGTIYDARGRELAVSVAVDSAFAVPREVDEPLATARRLAAATGARAEELAARLASDREFVWVGRKLDQPQAKAVRRLRLPGIYFLQESKRYYPLRELAAHVLGYVGTDDQGLAGLEALYDEVLAGRAARRTVLRDARRGTVVDPQLSASEAEPGGDLHLTIDASIQHIVERELERAVVEQRAKGGTAVVLDPRRGAILAMASRPTFDPNRFHRYPPAAWRNRAVMDAYEPGSTFKMITAAAALEANVVDPGDVIDCEMGAIAFARVRINDHRPFGLLTFREVIARSSNVGAIKLGLAVGGNELHTRILAFGFGRPTGVDLPGESHGIVHPLERPLNAAYVSFGQAISVTPLQLASAFAAVANGGHLLRPYAVAAIGPGQRAEPAVREPRVLSRPVSPATARSLERLLEAVVVEGTGGRAAVPGYRVAGKTGTAQKAIPGQGYSGTRFVASFVGFAPARRPQIVCLVLIDEPRGAHHDGGRVAAPVFAAIVERVLLYLGVPPERDPPERWPGEAAVGGVSRVADPPDRPDDGSREATSAGEGPQVPDWGGLTARQVLVRSSELGLAVRLHGRGFVNRQSPAPGSPLAAAAEEGIELWLGGRSSLP